ncbi:MAG: DNA repair protein RecO [Patescibacteria group bacterium]
MHHIYHTEGIILGSKDFGESGRYYYILTRDLGLVYAAASGVRKMSSKLRFILQDFAYLKIDLVQGKNIFRITSASKTNKLENITHRPETFKIIFNVSKLLRRLLAGVEPNEALFADLLSSLTFLDKLEKKEDLQNAEAVIVLRILHDLGYIGGDESIRDFIQSPFEESMVFEVASKRKNVLNEINKALKETHL